MRVKVRYFASISDRIGLDQEEIELPTGASLNALYKVLQGYHEALAEWRRVLLAVNGEYRDSSHVLEEGDFVAVFPSVSGG